MHVFGPWEEVPLVFGGRGSKQKPDCCEAKRYPLHHHATLCLNKELQYLLVTKEKSGFGYLVGVRIYFNLILGSSS